MMFSMWQVMGTEWELTGHSRVLMSPLTQDLQSLIDTTPYRRDAYIMRVYSEGDPVPFMKWLHGQWVYV